MRVDVDMIAEIDKADADEIRRTRARVYVAMTTTGYTEQAEQRGPK